MKLRLNRAAAMEAVCTVAIARRDTTVHSSGQRENAAQNQLKLKIFEAVGMAGIIASIFPVSPV